MTTIPSPPAPTKRGPKPNQKVLDAANYVIDGGWPVRQAARHFGVSPSAVSRRVKVMLDGGAK